MKTTIDTYNQQAIDFLKSTGTTFKCEFLKFDKYFSEDKEKRDIYNITLSRGGRSYSFNFGQSIRNSQEWTARSTYARNIVHKANYPRLEGKTKSEMLRRLGLFFNSGVIDSDFEKNKYYSQPNEYDVLACLTKYEVGTLEDFCYELGYNPDSKKDEKIYKAVLDEWRNVAMLWNEDELEQLREIS